MTSMRIVILLVLCFLIVNSFGQTVTVHYSKIRVADLLDSLQLQSDVNIAYDVNAVPVDSLVNINIRNQHPYEIISDLLKTRPLNIALVNGQIIISEIQVAEMPSKYIRIKGKVVDQEESYHLPLVNISIKGKALGTITNKGGEYEFVLPRSYIQDTLAFSCLGYATSFQPVPDNDSILNVSMVETSVKLAEVEVKYEDVDAIIEQAVHFRSDNYWDEKTLLTGFFRETIRQDDAFVQVSEAIVEIYKTEYNRPQGVERVRFVKGRKNKEVSPMDDVLFKLEGGPYYFSRLDVAKYLDFFPVDKKEAIYRYSYKGNDVYNDEMVYRIGFKPIDDTGQLLYQGELLIHSSSYAIVRAEFELTRRSLRQSKRSIIRKTSRKVKARPLEASYYIDYRPFQGRWILNKVRGIVRVQIVDKKHQVDSEFDAVTEMLISDMSSEGVERFKFSETFKPKYVLAEEIVEEDAAFWGNYNIIKPDEALEKVFKRADK